MSDVENEVNDDEVVDRGDDILAEIEEEVEAIDAEEEDDEYEEGESEEEEGEEEEEEQPKARKEPMLPKSRYDSVAQRNRELEARIAELESKGRQEEANAKREEQFSSIEDHISQLDTDYAEAVKDGDTEAMARIRREQRSAEREMYRLEMQQTGEMSSNRAQEQVRLDLTISAIEEQYTQLNPESEEYSQAVVDQIQELRAGFEATGRYSPTQALVRAVKFVIPDNVVAQESVREPQRKGDLKKKVAAANKQPPNLDGIGDQGNAAGKTRELDPTQLSEEDWEALPESTLKRMRGDAF